MGTYSKQLEEDVHFLLEKELAYEQLVELRTSLDKYLYDMNEEDESWDDMAVQEFVMRFLKKEKIEHEIPAPITIRIFSDRR